jgi:tetracycline repressor-like protein
MMRRVARHAAMALEAEGHPGQKIVAYLSGGLLEIQPFSHAFSEAIESYAPAGWLFNHHLAAARDTLIALIEEGISRREFRDIDAEIAAEAILAGTRRLLEPAFLNSSKLTATEALTEFFSIVVNGLAIRDPVDERRVRANLRHARPRSTTTAS